MNQDEDPLHLSSSCVGSQCSDISSVGAAVPHPIYLFAPYSNNSPSYRIERKNTSTPFTGPSTVPVPISLPLPIVTTPPGRPNDNAAAPILKPYLDPAVILWSAPTTLTDDDIRTYVDFAMKQYDIKEEDSMRILYINKYNLKRSYITIRIWASNFEEPFCYYSPSQKPPTQKPDTERDSDHAPVILRQNIIKRGRGRNRLKRKNFLQPSFQGNQHFQK